jgi:hypothetical protein
MKRYYLAPVVTVPDPDLGQLRQVDIPDGFNYSAAIGNTGSWALIIVAAQDHRTLTSNSKLVPLPDFPLDGKVSAIQKATKDQLVARAQQRLGITISADNVDGYRELIRDLGTRVDPNFHEDNFDVFDVS